MKRAARLLLFGWLALAGVAAFGAERLLPPGTPVFSEPLHTAPLVLAVWEDTPVEAGPARTVLVKKHPLARHYTFFPVTLPDGRRGFVDPNVRVELRAEGPQLCFASARTWWQWLLWGLTLAGGLALAAAHRRKRLPAALAWGLWPVWLHLMLAQAVALAAENLIASPMDENGYFANLQAALAGDWTTPWHFTVGLSILYAPFAALTGAASADDLVVPFSYFSVLVLTPARLLFAYLVGRKLLHSDRRSALAAGLWAAFPFFVHHFAGFADRCFRSWIGRPSATFDFSYYVTVIGSGFNAMSDNPAAAFLLAVMALVLYRPPAAVTALAAGGLFGFTCMIRCNTILYFPALLLLAGWETPLRAWLRPRVVLAGVLGFLIGFAPQFAVNTWFLGAPWRFSYTDYAHGAHTYCSWIFGDLNTAYYGAANHYPWMLGALGLWLMRDDRARLLFALWFWPAAALFLFYSHGTDDAVRFLLPTYPALFLAFAAALPRLRGRAWIAAAPLCLAVLLIPANATLGSWRCYGSLAAFRVFPVGWAGWCALAAALALAAYAWKRGERRLAALGAGMAALQLLGNAYLLTLLLAGAGAYAAVRLGLAWRRERMARA